MIGVHFFEMSKTMSKGIFVGKLHVFGDELRKYNT